MPLILMLQVAEAEEKTAGGLLLTQATKEKPSIGTVSFPIHFLQTIVSIYL
jgi:chaperonin GroES